MTNSIIDSPCIWTKENRGESSYARSTNASGTRERMRERDGELEKEREREKVADRARTWWGLLELERGEKKERGAGNGSVGLCKMRGDTNDQRSPYTRP